VEKVSALGDEPFLLRDIFKPLLAETYTQEQLDIQIKKKESDKTASVGQFFAYYIPFLAKKLGVFEYLGDGKFRNVSIDEELAEADSVAVDVESDDSGIIYAYSFPSIHHEGSRQLPHQSRPDHGRRC
jgi:hypothetical protein